MSIFFELLRFALRGVGMSVQVRGAYREEAAVTLRRASSELRNAIAMVEELEQAVGLAIALAGEAGAEQMFELQKLDHLQQKIIGVADFLDALSAAMPPDWRVDAKLASRRVLLADLGARLGDASAGKQERASAPETYELF
jgi:hypothetical protein